MRTSSDSDSDARGVAYAARGVKGMCARGCPSRTGRLDRGTQMALKQYEEEYVASLEAEVRNLQKERHYLQTKVQDLLAELERSSEANQRSSAH